MEQCFEPRTCSPAASARNVLVCASLGKGKGFGVWVGFHEAFLVPGMEVLVIANLFPENKGIYSSVSTLAGPAVCRAAALPAVQNQRPTEEHKQ